MAYSHAFAVLGDSAEAERVAIAALRKGAHSRVAVLAHARHLAIQRATSSKATAGTIVAADLRDVAAQLSGTRPAVEQAIVDLELRYGLDTASFARVVGLANDRAAERASAVAAAWNNTLDPALMAWLGPGSCPSLESLLSSQRLWPRNDGVSPSGAPNLQLAATGTDPAPRPIANLQAAPLLLNQLLEVAPLVAEHASDCEVCEQRLSLMTSVRTVTGQSPPDVVPPAVAAAARAARRRLASPLPPSIEPHRLDLGRLRTMLVAAAGALAIGLLGWGIVASVTDNTDTQDERVARLLETPRSQLLGTPSVITPDTKTAALANNGDEPISWRASSTAAWLTLQPTSGRVAPAQSISIAITANPPTRGDSSAVVTITGEDGSRQTLRYENGK